MNKIDLQLMDISCILTLLNQWPEESTVDEYAEYVYILLPFVNGKPIMIKVTEQCWKL